MLARVLHNLALRVMPKAKPTKAKRKGQPTEDPIEAAAVVEANRGPALKTLIKQAISRSRVHVTSFPDCCGAAWQSRLLLLPHSAAAAGMT
jgi:hypothetical protein